MTQPFDPEIWFPIKRAARYPFAEEWTDDTVLVEAMEVDHLRVDVDVVEVGRVTLSAAGPAPSSDEQGVDFDLEPRAARQLGEQLVRAAEACERLHEREHSYSQVTMSSEG